MIFVTGGFAAGKQAWVQAHLGYTDADCSRDADDACPVLLDLQDSPVDSPAALRHKQVVLCDEVGCGLVPVEPAERARRERVGRLSIALAAQAEIVVRVVCGVGTVIKGVPTWK